MFIEDIIKLYIYMAKTIIKELCKQKGVKQIELAKILDMREDSLSIAIKRDTLSIDKLDIIANHLGVEIAELFAPREEGVIICPKCGSKFKVIE